MGPSSTIPFTGSILKGSLEIGGERIPISEFPKRFEESGTERDDLRSISDFIRRWKDEEESIEAMTSGSTGERKAIQLSKEGMRASARMTIAHYSIPEEARALFCLSADYIAGKMMLVRAMEGDWTLLVVEPSRDPVASIEEGERFDFSAMVPMQVQEALEDQKKKSRFECIETLIIGGAPVDERLEKRIRSVRTACYATYGMTETLTHIADRALNGPDASDRYTPMEGVELESDRRGCLLVRAPHLFEGEVKTNDLVDLEDDGSFRIRGRFDRLINSGAVKLLPEELERKLEAGMDRRFFIDKEPDEELGECVVLFLEGAPLDEVTERLLYAYMKDHLEAYEVPKRIVSIPSFAETGSGKVDRLKSREKVAEA
jgi:O-succinylbenzoic acid--CoA ligase